MYVAMVMGRVDGATVLPDDEHNDWSHTCV